MEDEQILRRFSSTLATLPQVSLYPEDQLEARLLFGSEIDAVSQLDQNDPLYTKRHRYLYETLQHTRARRLAQELQQRLCVML